MREFDIPHPPQLVMFTKRDPDSKLDIGYRDLTTEMMIGHDMLPTNVDYIS